MDTPVLVSARSSGGRAHASDRRADEGEVGERLATGERYAKCNMLLKPKSSAPPDDGERYPITP